MKKNLNAKKIAALTLAFTVLGTTAAYADVMNGEAAAEPVALADAAEETEAAAYITTSGKIVDISDTQDGNKVITIDNENGGLRFVVSAATVIADRATNAIITVDQMTDGMEVTVVYGANSPMGMSMPPYLGSVTAVVANADKGFVSVGLFNEDLVNTTDMLQLNIQEPGNIQTTLGTKSILGADSVKNKNAVVFYDVTTRSIPAQTTPSMVLLLEEREAVEETEAAPVEESTTRDASAPETVALRDAAEAMGYTVTWQGKAEPVLLEKDGIVSSVTLGSTTYVVEGDMAMDAASAPVLVDGVLYVSSDVIDSLK